MALELIRHGMPTTDLVWCRRLVPVIGTGSGVNPIADCQIWGGAVVGDDATIADRVADEPQVL